MLRGLWRNHEARRSRAPERFPVLRVLADERPIRRRFLVLGSASPSLLEILVGLVLGLLVAAGLIVRSRR